MSTILKQPSSYNLVRVSLFILSLLLFQMNSKLCCFRDFKISNDGSGRTENKYVSLGKIKDLKTVILPIVVNLCRFQIVISFRKFSILC